jgi:hypothetical protein
MNYVIMVKRAVHLYETPASYVLWCVSKIVQKPSGEIMLSTGNKVMLRSKDHNRNLVKNVSNYVFMETSLPTSTYV